MKKVIIFAVLIGFMFSVSNVAFGRTLQEERLAVQDFMLVIDAKIVKAKTNNQYAKVTAMKAQKADALARLNKLDKAIAAAAVPAPVVAPVPPPAPAPVAVKPEGLTKLLRLGLNTNLGAHYIQDGKHSSIWGSSGVTANLVLDDFIGLGPKLGHLADTIKYTLGLGGYYVLGDGGIKALPVYAGGIIYLPHWLGGQETYLSGDLNYVVYGNGQTSGKIGGDISFGVTADFGFGLGKTGFEIGYSVVRSNTITSKGLSLSITQPLAL